MHTPPLGLTLTPLPSLASWGLDSSRPRGTVSPSVGGSPTMGPTVHFSKTGRCSSDPDTRPQVGSPLSQTPSAETCWGLARLHSRVSHECSHFFIRPPCSEHTRVLDFLALRDLQKSSHPVWDGKKKAKTCPRGVGEPLFGGASPATADHRTQGTPAGAGAGCALPGALAPATKHAAWR